MQRSHQIINLLYEAKSFKNSVPKWLRIEVDKYIKDILQDKDSSRKLQSRLRRLKITNTDSLISYIEKEFKKVNYSILSDYVEWTIRRMFFSIRLQTAEQVLVETKHIAEILLQYAKLKNKGILNIVEANIFSYNFTMLVNLIHNNKHHLMDDKDFYKERTAELLHENNRVKIVRVHNEKAVDYFSSGSRGRSNPWCISKRGHFDEYAMNGYKWVLLLVKKSDEKYAIDITFELVWDKKNKEVDIDHVVSTFPILRKIIPSLDKVPFIMRPFVANLKEYFQMVIGPYLSDYEVEQINRRVAIRYEGPRDKGFLFLVVVDRKLELEDTVLNSGQIMDIASEVAEKFGCQVTDIEYPDTKEALIYLVKPNSRW